MRSLRPLFASLSFASMSSLSTMPARRGAFILFEGIDRCGKTTQCSLLGDHLRSVASEKGLAGAELIQFPNRKSTIGTLINSYLESKSEIDDHTIHLLFSANRWEQRESIEKRLSSGISLVCDRYAYSGVAFSSAKGLDTEWCKSSDVGLPCPDCIIYLDMPVEEAAKRGCYGEERYEKIEFQKSVREKFMVLRSSDEEAKRVPWVVIDARQSIEEISSEIKKITDNILNSDVLSKPIAKLWT